MRRCWLLPLIAPLLVAVVAAGACGEDDATTGTPPTSSATGLGGGGGAGGEAPGVPRFGDARILVGGQFRPTRLVLDGDFLYWTTRGGTAGGGAAALGGSGGAGGAGGAAGQGGVGAVQGGGGAGGDGEIVILGAVVRVRKTGGTPSTVVTAPSVTGITVAGPHVYFTVLDDQEVGSIAVVPVEGGDPITVVDGLGWPADVAVGDDLLYWSEVGSEGGLWVAPKPEVHFDVGGGGAGGGLTGSGGQGGASGIRRIHSGSALLTFLEIDEETLYFSDHGVAAHAGAIGAVPLGSANADADLIVEGIDRPRYFAFDADHLYVVTEGDGRVQRFAKSGSGAPTVLAYDQDRPYGIAVDDRAVYWTNSGTTPPAGECEAAVGTIMAMPLGGGEVVELASNQACPLAIAVDDTGLYWINVGRDSDLDSGAVMRMPKR